MVFVASQKFPSTTCTTWRQLWVEWHQLHRRRRWVVCHLGMCKIESELSWVWASLSHSWRPLPYGKNRAFTATRGGAFRAFGSNEFLRGFSEHVADPKATPLLRVPTGVKYSYFLRFFLLMVLTPHMLIHFNCFVQQAAWKLLQLTQQWHWLEMTWSSKTFCIAEVLGLASGSSGYARRAVLLRCAELVRVPKWSQMHSKNDFLRFFLLFAGIKHFFHSFSISIFCYQKHFVFSFLSESLDKFFSAESTWVLGSHIAHTSKTPTAYFRGKWECPTLSISSTVLACCQKYPANTD